MIDLLIEIDKKIFLYLNNGSSLFDDFFVFITNSTNMTLITIPVIIYLVTKHQKKNKYLILFCIFLTFILTDFIHFHAFKEVFQRLRPCWDPEISNACRVLVDKGGLYGFVSGHASNTVALVSIIFFTFPKLKRWFKDVLIIWAVVICYSRIYVGKHFPLDVIFGSLLGFIIAYIVFKLFFSHFVTKQRKNYGNQNI